MVHPLAKEIKVDQLRLADEARRCLANLAMSVEIKERKRFPVSNTVDQVIELINVSTVSASQEVKVALSNLTSVLTPQQEHLLLGIGASLFRQAPAAPEPAEDKAASNGKKYVFGARG